LQMLDSMMCVHDSPYPFRDLMDDFRQSLELALHSMSFS
jgi:hypothetical protein